MEKWDLFNEKREPINKLHNRQEPLQKGEYHIVVGIWTVNSQNEILLTLRHPDKLDYPNCWENTGGCVLAGETSRQGAKRELFEETGISIDEDELFLLGTERGENAFGDTYIVRKDVDLSNLTMQEGETVEAKWVTLEQLDEMIASGVFVKPLGEKLETMREAFERYLLSK